MKIATIRTIDALLHAQLDEAHLTSVRADEAWQALIDHEDETPHEQLAAAAQELQAAVREEINLKKTLKDWEEHEWH